MRTHEVKDDDEHSGQQAVDRQIAARARNVVGRDAVHPAGALLQDHLELGPAYGLGFRV